jgi:ABC-type spermidine/putrescine transport system permease subunit II
MELLEIIAVSLNVSFFSTIIAGLIGIPVGLHIARGIFILNGLLLHALTPCLLCLLW